MKFFKLLLTAILLMLLGCTENSDENGTSKPEPCQGLPQGSLSSREGEAVTEENLEEVITILMTELQMALLCFEEENNRPVEVILGYVEEERTEEHIKGQEVRSWMYEYFDFSRTDGRLFIGGGVLINETREGDGEEQGAWLMEQKCIKIRFNGMYKGELVVSTTAEWILLSGSSSVRLIDVLIKIDSKDVTDIFTWYDFSNKEIKCR